MRVLPLLAVAALLLAGCSSKPDAAAADATLPTGDGAGVADATNVTYVLQFAGGTQEAELPVAEAFAPTDTCFFITPCAQRTIDLTSIVPADVPVELAIRLSVTGDGNAWVQGDDAVSFVQYSSEYDSGRISIDVLLVRGADGAVQLGLDAGFASFDPATASQGKALTGTAHSVVRASVVPAYVPVSVRLGPGDAINASGDIEQLVAYAPSGEAIRDLTYPFGFQVPAGAAEGTYILLAVADEAIRLTGPNRTLAAHRLVFTESEPVDAPMGQEASWDMAVAGLPVSVGVMVSSKETVPDCCGVASYMGPRHVHLVSPGNVDVLAEDVDCLPFMGCPVNPLGTTAYGYGSGFLEEHLVPGTYHGSVTVDQGNNLQAYSWAVYIQ